MPHLLSNLVFGGLFGYPAARLFGPGLAWLLIVAGAGLAYGIDALLHPPQHYLLGASTAVFTSLGLIAAYGWRRHLRDWKPWMRNASPLLGGFALLAFTGTGGENTDILAHFAGFAVGTAIGAVCARLPMPPPGRSGLQWASGLAAVALIVIAWAMALR
jgi:rhomboid protease GluP